jgi:hypothetical protein
MALFKRDRESDFPTALTCSCGSGAVRHCSGRWHSHACPWYDCGNKACKSRLTITGPKDEYGRWPVRRCPIPEPPSLGQPRA